MADVKIPECDTESLKCTDARSACYDKIIARTKEISSLVIMARMQANEADIRARYSVEFARKAASEALAAHQVCETLVNTANVVSTLSNECLDNTCNFLDAFNDYLSDSDNSSEWSLDRDSTEVPFTTLPMSSNVCASSTSSNPAPCAVTDTHGNVGHKYETTYPEHLRQTIESCIGMPTTLPTLWETSCDQTPAGLIDTSDGNETEMNMTEELKQLEIKRKMLLYKETSCDQTPARLADGNDPNEARIENEMNMTEELKQLEIKRTMLLYKDSKLIANTRVSFERGDAQNQNVPLTYQECGTQTTPKTVADMNVQ